MSSRKRLTLLQKREIYRNTLEINSSLSIQILGLRKIFDLVKSLDLVKILLLTEKFTKSRLDCILFFEGIRCNRY